MDGNCREEHKIRVFHQCFGYTAVSLNTGWGGGNQLRHYYIRILKNVRIRNNLRVTLPSRSLLCRNFYFFLCYSSLGYILLEHGFFTCVCFSNNIFKLYILPTQINRHYRDGGRTKFVHTPKTMFLYRSWSSSVATNAFFFVYKRRIRTLYCFSKNLCSKYVDTCILNYTITTTHSQTAT